MSNKYSYIGGKDLNAPIFVCQEKRGKYDINSVAIKRLVGNIRDGKLKEITNEFNTLNSNQKLELLTMIVEIRDLWGIISSLNLPYGTAINFSEQYKQSEIVEYLKRQKITFTLSLFSTT